MVHIIITIALITSRNNPKVKMVNGKVNKIIMGFDKILMIPKTKSDNKRGDKISHMNPDIKLAMSKTNTAVITRRVLFSYM